MDNQDRKASIEKDFSSDYVDKEKNNVLVTPQKSRKYSTKLFNSPSSRAQILTPIKSALHESNRNTSKFIKKIQEIVDNKNKENIETDREI